MKLLDELINYQGFDELEEKKRIEMIQFIRQHNDCFKRELLIGHITASAWVLNENFTKTLLIHHKKLDKWLHPGGHCDGEIDTLVVAEREVWEETGIENLKIQTSIFDIDIHPIPQHKLVPAHLHYDVRYLFIVNENETLVRNQDEINELKWVPISDVLTYNNEPSFRRLQAKTVAL